MNFRFRINRKVRLVFSKLGSLLLLFQRTPIVQIILPEARVMSTTGVGELVKWTVATVAGLGAYDTVAGATTMTQIAPLPVVTPIAATTGTSMSFTVQVTGAPGSPQSWQITGTLPTGIAKTNSGSTCTLSGIPTNTGSFPITIKAWENSNFSGGSISKAFTISVSQGLNAPTITTNPISTTINSGSTATLTVEASGTSPTFQWYVGASGTTTNPVSGATSASFTTPALTSNITYWVRATNSAGFANSTAATVSVRIPPAITTQPASVAIVSGTTTLTAAASGTSPTFQWYLGNSGDTTNPIPAATSATYTPPAPVATTSYWVKATNAAGSANSDTATVTIIKTPVITSQPAAVTINSGTTTVLTVSASGYSPTFQWYVGNSGDTANPIPGATSASYTTPVAIADTRYWVRVTNAAGSANSNAAMVSIAIIAPLISSQPASIPVNSGTTTTLSVKASGTSPGFQWYVGNSGDISNPISGAVSDSYTTPPLSDTTSYWVRAVNTAGTADSDTATVTVTVVIAPTITSQPPSAMIFSGETATLTASASGNFLSFQWYRGTTGNTSNPVAGATADSYTTPALTAAASYWVRIFNSAGSVDSDTATVDMIAPPVIATQPASVSISSGASATLTVAATGVSPVFQWYIGSAGVTTSPIAGAVSASYTTPPLTAAGSYWVRVGNGASSVDSATASVKILPTITKQPATITIKKGTSTTLKVVAVGGGLTYQWYIGKSGVTTTPIAKATAASYKTPALKTTTKYWVKVKNPVGSVNSNAATVKIATAVAPSGLIAAAGLPVIGTFEDWQSAQFSLPQLTDPAISGPGADPDGDGISNDREYILGLLPLTAEAAPAPAIEIANGRISVSFATKSASGPGYSGRIRHYALETADRPNSGSWKPQEGFSDIIGNDQSVTYQGNLPAPSGFYHLKIWLTP